MKHYVQLQTPKDHDKQMYHYNDLFCKGLLLTREKAVTQFHKKPNGRKVTHAKSSHWKSQTGNILQIQLALANKIIYWRFTYSLTRLFICYLIETILKHFVKMQGLIIASRHLDSHSKANCLKKRFNAIILPPYIHRWQHHSKSTWILVKRFYRYTRLYHVLLYF